MEILYGDREILVCVKPAGILSEEGEGAMPELLRAAVGPGEIFCVHRLDRETGGLMVYARTRDAAAALSRTIAAGQLAKRYLAVVQGAPEAPAGELRDLLYRDARKNKSFVVRRARRGVREAVLRYETLESREGLSLLRVELVTGRSHQIRVQFASRGLPLAGDGRYGSAWRDCGLALWSAELSFPHPRTGEQIAKALPPPAVWPWTLFEGLSAP
ncbi:MAG: RluA family pseudouridine synthase [Oscillospiraceae bacterium]|nr:RluA family pseudouridine synthase [Oscillospiraceae bacterium]